MRLSIKAKQVLGVTSTVGAVVVVLSFYYLSLLAGLSLRESQARGQLVARTVYQRAQAVVPRAADRYAALRDDPGMRSILESSNYSRDVTDAAIVDPSGRIVAHWDPRFIGRIMPPRPQIVEFLQMSGFQQVWTIFTDPGRTFEVREPLLLDSGAGPSRQAEEFGAIRVGISTLLVWRDLREALGPALGTVLGALLVATFVAMLLAQLFLRPIHVLRSGLTRLQQGETGITLDLPKDEFGDLGTFFRTVSDKLSADRSELAGQKASLENVVARLEDAVAIYNPVGKLLFANPAMRAIAPGDGAEPWRELLQTTIATRQSHGPVAITAPATGSEAAPKGERLLITHPIQDDDGRLMGVMVIARNLDYLGQVQSTLRYSQKLTALGRLSAGVAHEVKNPLNAMMIHLELLRQKLSRYAGVPAAVVPGGILDAPQFDASSAIEHVSVISSEIRRLDQVLQGFLRFNRPEDLRLQPLDPAALLREVAQVVQPEADKTHVRLEIDAPPNVPFVNADASMLRQALMNLALNACQAMPNGGMLRFRARHASGRRVELRVEDTGLGIKPEHLARIFDLYFTTRDKGSGIGLSMVYRTVQLHDGEIEVQSTPGVGTAFRILLPQS
jgi:signal transduction histidine kinase